MNSGMLQALTSSYARIRHYDKSVNGKPRFIYHRVSMEYINRILANKPSNIDQNLNNLGSNLKKYVAGLP